MADILFINPYYKRYNGPITDNRLPPLGLINCATILQNHGHKVEILDAHILEISGKDVPFFCVHNHYDVIVVTSSPLNTWQCPPVTIEPFYQTVDALRNKFSKAKMIGLGPGSLLHQEGMLQVCDLIIYGQPEPFFLQIASCFDWNQWLTLPNVICKNPDGEIQHAEFVKKFDMTLLPIPNYSLVSYTKYRFGIMESWVVELETSRGCPQFCEFCFQGMTHYKYSRKRVDQVLKEMRYVSDVLKGKNVFFIDLDFGVHEKFLNELLDAFIKEKISIQWACNIRSSRLNPGLLRKMKQANCQGVLIGIETADEALQKDMQKNVSIVNLKEKISLIRQHGIEVSGYFILGFPHETEEKIIETIDLACSLNLDYASFQILTPYPNRKDMEEMHKGEQPRIAIANNRTITYQRLLELQSLAYRKFYLRPAYIIKRLTLLRNPKALVSNIKVFLKAAFQF